jgi:hypothetical protein
MRHNKYTGIIELAKSSATTPKWTFIGVEVAKTNRGKIPAICAKGINNGR